MKRYLHTSDIALFFLRFTAGFLMLIYHGLPKTLNIPAIFLDFPDPLRISPLLSSISVIFSEVLCSLLLILGIKVRWVAAPLIFTMFVVGFIFHLDDPFAQKEKAILFMSMYVTTFVYGSDKYCLLK